MKALLLLLTATTVLTAAPAAAQSIAGDWDASFETPGGARTSRLILQVEGQKVTGTVKRETGDAALTGTIVGDTLRFSYTIAYNENLLVMSVMALATPDGLRGTVSFGGQAETAWWATRPPAAARRPSSRQW